MRTQQRLVAWLDTGASCHDFISEQLANALIADGAVTMPVTGRVCSAFQGSSSEMTASVICKYEFFNEQTLSNDVITIRQVILKNLSAPLIVGLQTIGEHKLLNKQLPLLCDIPRKKKRPSAQGTPPSGALARQVTALETAAHEEENSKSGVLTRGSQPRRP